MQNSLVDVEVFLFLYTVLIQVSPDPEDLHFVNWRDCCGSDISSFCIPLLKNVYGQTAWSPDGRDSQLVDVMLTMV